MAMRSKRVTKREAKQPERRAVMTASAARERIHASCGRPVLSGGVQAVGVDAVIARAGVNKMSLYRNFGSKDQLITAFLEDRNRQYWEWWDAVMQRHDGGPRQKLYGLFEDLQARVHPQGLSRLSVRQPGGGIEQRRNIRPAPSSRATSRSSGGVCASLRRAARVKDPEALSESLILLMEGAYASSQTCGSDGPANSLARTAKALIDAQYSKRKRDLRQHINRAGSCPETKSSSGSSLILMDCFGRRQSRRSGDGPHYPRR